MSDLVRPGASPFDQIRHEDEQGEHWTARELMVPLGYDQWRRFEDAVERARRSAENVGANVTRHFFKIVDIDGADKINDLGYRQRDYRLTRYAAYLIAMNGDPRKKEIAEAQTYFAVKAREAEVRDHAPAVQQSTNLPDLATYEGKVVLLDMLREQVERTRALELENAQQQQELDETHAYVDHIEPDAEAFQGLVKEHPEDYDAKKAASLLCGMDARIRIGRNTLLAKLRDWKVLDNYGEVYARYKNNFYLKLQYFTDPKTGEEREGRPQVRIRKGGLSWIRRRLIEEIELTAAEAAAQDPSLFDKGHGSVTRLPARREDNRPGGAS